MRCDSPKPPAEHFAREQHRAPRLRNWFLRPDDEELPVGKISFGSTSPTAESPDRFLGDAPIVNDNLLARIDRPGAVRRGSGNATDRDNPNPNPDPLPVTVPVVVRLLLLKLSTPVDVAMLLSMPFR